MAQLAWSQHLAHLIFVCVFQRPFFLSSPSGCLLDLGLFLPKEASWNISTLKFDLYFKIWSICLHKTHLQVSGEKETPYKTGLYWLEELWFFWSTRIVGWCLISRLAHPLGCNAACQWWDNASLPFLDDRLSWRCVECYKFPFPPGIKNIYWQHFA